jgi:crooked neck
MKFAELEKELGDLERARAIFELAITQPLDMPEVVWKAYIDFEYEEEEWDRTRALYKRLLERTSHVKVWISWAQFESNAGKTIARAYRDQDDDEEDEEGDEQAHAKEKVVSPEAEEAAQQAERDGLAAARKVFEDGYKDLKSRQLKQERLILLEAWKALETADGDAESLGKVEAMMPRVIKKRRAVSGDASQQEDMLFPVSPTCLLISCYSCTATDHFACHLRTTKPPPRAHRSFWPWLTNGLQKGLLLERMEQIESMGTLVLYYSHPSCCPCAVAIDSRGCCRTGRC